MHRDIFVCLLVFSAGVIWSPLAVDNFSNAKDTLSAVASIATIIGVGFAIYVGLSGLKAWRKQMTSSQDHELAKRSLLAIQSLKESIELARDPLVFPEPTSAAERLKHGIGIIDAHDQGVIEAYKQRWNSVVESAKLVASCACEADILWGETFRELLSELNQPRRKLFLAIQRKIASLRPTSNELNRQKILEKMEQETHILYSGWDEDDVFRNELESIFKKIEVYLAKHLVRS